MIQIPVELAETNGDFVVNAEDSFETKVMKVMLLPQEFRDSMGEAACETLDVLEEVEFRLDKQKMH